MVRSVTFSYHGHFDWFLLFLVAKLALHALLSKPVYFDTVVSIFQVGIGNRNKGPISVLEPIFFSETKFFFLQIFLIFPSSCKFL